jgi:hypothetical protein
MWTTNLSGSKDNANQFIIAAVAAIALGIYSFTLPKCPPPRSISKDAGIIEQLGLKAFTYLGTYKMALFFIFFHDVRRRFAIDKYVWRFFSFRFCELILNMQIHLW